MSQNTPADREFFHIGENYYATIKVDETLEPFPLRLRAFKECLINLFHPAKRTDKTANRADSARLELPAGEERPILLWGWCSRRWATGLLISVFLGAVPLLYSYRGDFGELLIQLGERFAVEPATHIVVLPPPVPAALPQARRQAHVVPLAQAPIPSLPHREPSSPPLTEAVEPGQAVLRAAALPAENLSTSLMTSLPISPAGPILNLTSSEPIELAQPEEANRGARDTRDLAPIYTDSSAGKYFEVVKFRDGFHANQAIDELVQLGFRAIIVHSRVLWMNSYHVLVGPYSNQDEVEAARYRLQSRGFNPRVLQSKSKRLRTPPMTLYGSDLTIRDCVITWELNSPEATVEFMQGRTVVATSKGRWEKRDFAFKSNAIVSRENERGPETLLEIQNAGMDQGLVLDGSVLRFYMGR